MGLFKGLGAAEKIKADNFFERSELGKPVKEKFPLELRNGSMVGVSLSKRLIFEEAFTSFLNENLSVDGLDDLNALRPSVNLPESPQVILAWSLCELGGIKLFKFYLDGQHLLEVAVEASSMKPVENGITFWSFGGEMFPSSMEDWNEWLPSGENESWWIGYPYYPLDGQDLDAEGKWVEWAYQRLSNDSEGCSTPIKSRELVKEGFFEKSPEVRLAHESTTYYRKSPASLFGLEVQDPDNVELLRITAVTNETEGEKSIEFWHGVRLSENHLEII